MDRVDHEPVGSKLPQARKGSLDLAFRARVEDVKLKSQAVRRGLSLSLDMAPALGLAGFASPAMMIAVGTASCSSSTRFAHASTFKFLMPVTLPLGRLMLATRPISTGSAAAEKTIGIVMLPVFAARAEGPPPTTITATLRLTRSAASAGN
jgi:hypothetical protein